MSDCILWEKGTDKNGYGKVKYRGKDLRAHRLIYVQYHKVTLDTIRGWLVCHTCDTPPCVNPEHLYLGTNSTNQLDMHRRQPWKASHPKRPLQDLREISFLLAHDCGSRWLRKEFKVSGLWLEKWMPALLKDVRPIGRPKSNVCRNGHFRTEENTGYSGNNRFCRVCRRLKDKEYYPLYKDAKNARRRKGHGLREN